MMPMPERSIRVDHPCRDLVPERVVHVVEVVFDAHAIRIRYSITPPLAEVQPAAGSAPPIRWDVHAVDDLGTTYTYAGSAYGLSPAGRRTEGVLSLVPLPPPTAATLTVVLQAWVASEADRTECRLTMELTSGGR